MQENSVADEQNMALYGKDHLFAEQRLYGILVIDYRQTVFAHFY